jgi:hypothetical protein
VEVGPIVVDEETSEDHSVITDDDDDDDFPTLEELLAQLRRGMGTYHNGQ